MSPNFDGPPCITLSNRKYAEVKVQIKYERDVTH